MLVGKKTQAFPSKERNLYSLTLVNTNMFARNLRKSDLGGFIFGCKHNTIKECLFKQLFGLPTQYFSYVKKIDQGLPLFLFNYSDRKLHGIFEADSPGQMNINPYGWTACGSERTLYPAQVRIRIRMHCQVLGEEQFRPIISQNYYTSNRFCFELDHSQTSGLISLFSSSPIIVSTSVPRNTALWNTFFQAIPTPDTRQDTKDFNPLASEENLSHSNQSKKELDYLGAAPCLNTQSQQPATLIILGKSISENITNWVPSAVAPCLDGKSKLMTASEATFSPSDQSKMECRSVSETDFVTSDQSNTECKFLGISPCLDGESQLLPVSEINNSNEDQSDLESRCSDTTTCLHAEIMPLPASKEEAGNSAKSSTKSVSSSGTVYLDGDRQPSRALELEFSYTDQSSKECQSSGITPYCKKCKQIESYLDEETLENNEEERVYQKLKHLVLKRESSKRNAEDAPIPFVSNDMRLKAPMASEENHEEISICSPNLLVDIVQLMQRLKEIKVFQAKQIQKMSSLEEKLEIIAREDQRAKLAMEEVPMLQAEIIKICHSMGKAIIMASDILASLIFYPKSDITLEVGEDADALKFSREIINGK